MECSLQLCFLTIVCRTLRDTSDQISRSVLYDSLRPHKITARQASLSITNSWSSLRFMSIESVMPTNHLIFSCPLLPHPQSFLVSGSFPELVLCIRWPKYCSFSINPSSEYSGLISFRIDWFDLLAIQGTLKSLLQHHSLEASILQHSAFLMVQLSHDYWQNHCFDYMDLRWQSDVSAFQYAV